jgi:CMP-N-acetylneuraminic acid synthetase
MRTIALIPARGGSKRLPNKNIKMLDGLPLLVHSINFALLNKDIIDDVFVSTDSDVIKQVALEYGAKVIDRPEALSGDLEPTISTLKHALSLIDNVDDIVLIQPTNPLRPDGLLQEAYKIYKEHKLESLFTVSRNADKLGKIIDNKFQPFNYSIGQRSQDLESLYYENGLLYITKASLIKKDIIFNKNTYPLVVNHKFAEVDIDTQDDIDYAEYLLKKHNE